MRYPKALTITLLLAGLVLAGGCGPARSVASSIRVPFTTRSGKALSSTMRAPYPSPDVERGEPMDIEVIRDGNAILLDNRTVYDYTDVELWLNQEYGGRLDTIAIGRGQAVALKSFYNRYGEHYPVGRFLQPDLDRSLISAELVIDGKLRRLTVRLEDDWRDP